MVESSAVRVSCVEFEYVCICMDELRKVTFANVMIKLDGTHIVFGKESRQVLKS